jgi:hypothetical protein
VLSDAAAIFKCGDEDAPDGCAICGAPRPECIDPAHFGARGESPPDSKCKLCTVDQQMCSDGFKHFETTNTKSHSPRSKLACSSWRTKGKTPRPQPLTP